MVYKLSNIGIQENYVNKKTHSSFFVGINFEVWVYKEMKIHFLLEILKLSQMTPFHTTNNAVLINNVYLKIA